MYNVIVTYKTPSKVAPYVSSSPAEKARLDQFCKAQAAAPGFVSARNQQVDDATLIVVTVWDTKASLDAFLAAHSELIDQLMRDRSAYHAAHGIKRTVQFQTS